MPKKPESKMRSVQKEGDVLKKKVRCNSQFSCGSYIAHCQSL